MKFRNKQRSRGATLIEVLVAVLIVSFGILGLVGLHARAIQFSLDAEDRNRAAMFADDLAAQMRLARTVTLNPAVIVTFTQRVQGIDPGTGLPTNTGLPNGGVALAAGPAPNSMLLTITWRHPSQPDDSRLETLIVLTNEEVT